MRPMPERPVDMLALVERMRAVSAEVDALYAVAAAARACSCPAVSLALATLDAATERRRTMP